jgi:16S rRNA A1518/A1519 N6-dimethyltransferase RsmA/KsgA/DIM1 with predicted DNA glycosylase/AP lyase activity
VLVLLSHIRPSSINSIGRINELLASAHEIAFNAKRETLRKLAIQSITSVIDADSLFENYFQFYQALIQRVETLSNNSLVSLLQLVRLLISLVD